MNADSLLTKAVRLARRRRYGEAIRLLEPRSFVHDSFRYYYILAYSCLLAAISEAPLPISVVPGKYGCVSPPFFSPRCAPSASRGNRSRGDLYLEVLDREPRNRLAAKALDVVRKRGDPETLIAWIEGGNLKRLYPPVPELPSSPRGRFNHYSHSPRCHRRSGCIRRLGYIPSP